MTRPRDPEALLAAYFADGMDVLPDRVAQSVLDEVHRTRQRPVIGARTHGSAFRTALAAAVVVAVLTVGGMFVVTGQPRPSARASASLPGIVAPSAPAAPTSSVDAAPVGAWIATGSMGAPRSGHTAVRLLDGRVLVVGGGPGEADTTAELYDPDTGTWSATGNMLKPPGGFPATLLRDGKVLVGNIDDPGLDRSRSEVWGAELYDPEFGTWTSTGEMVWGRPASTATLLRDGTVLVRGDGGSELFDPDSGTWTATRSRATQRHSHAAVLLPDGKVLVAGGHAPGDEATDSAELYDPDTGSWTAIAKMRAKLGLIQAFLQSDGKVLVVGVGGIGHPGSPYSVELYDPDTGLWDPRGDSSSLGIWWGSATLLSDGTVLLVGSGNGNDTAHLYDPGAGSWSTAAPMVRSQQGAAVTLAATLLLDGTVLVAGGHSCSTGHSVCVATSAAELYVPVGVPPPSR